MASLYRLDVTIRGNSDILQDEAIKWTKNWVNDRQEDSDNKDSNGNYLKEFYADLFDSRTLKAWKIFSDVATENRDIENEYITKNNETIKGVIYTTPYIVGVSKEILVDNENGTKHIDYENENAKIFLQVEDSLKAIPRVENQNENGFDVVLYDGEYFEDDEVTLNCSENPIKVNILIIKG